MEGMWNLGMKLPSYDGQVCSIRETFSPSLITRLNFALMAQQGAAPLFIEAATVYCPQELKNVDVQDSIGMDGIARHQRLLAATMCKSDHVVFVVEKDLKVGGLLINMASMLDLSPEPVPDA
jgi:hypothetical protein